MVNKKKYSNMQLQLSMAFLLFVFLCIFSGNSYAMTDDEFDYYLEYVRDNYPENTDTTTYMSTWFNTYSITDIRTNIKNKVDFTNYNFFTLEVFKSGNSAYTLFSFFDTTDGKAVYKSDNYTMVLTIGNNTNRLGYQTSNITTEPLRRFTSATSNYNMFASLNQSNRICFAFPTIDFYTSYDDTTPTSFYNLTGKELITTTYSTNSIDLAATSNYKFGFNNKNQLNVYLQGYSIYDFKFYIQRYIDGEWDNFTDGNDYYILINSDTGNIFENPYFVNWININYFPVGTYRYMAEYTGDNAFSVVSEDFNITNGSVGDSGTATGTIDENGNVDININVDNGNSVNDIKDFIGGPADFNNTTISQNDIDKAVNLDFIDNPYENFILNFFNGLVSSLSADASDITFRVHTWGQLRTVSVADFTPNYNNDIRVFLTIISTIVWCFVIVKWCTKIIDGLTHMSIQDCVDLVDAHYSNLF